MSDEKNEEANKIDLNETNEDGEILTLSDLLNEQREIDEVSPVFSISIKICLNK